LHLLAVDVDVPLGHELLALASRADAQTRHSFGEALFLEELGDAVGVDEVLQRRLLAHRNVVFLDLLPVQFGVVLVHVVLVPPIETLQISFSFDQLGFLRDWSQFVLLSQPLPLSFQLRLRFLLFQQFCSVL